MKPNPSQLRAYLAMSFYALKAAIRNRSTLFFSLIFPIVFISVFGIIGGTGQELNLGFPSGQSNSNPVIQTIKKLPFVILHEDSKDNLSVRLKQGRLDGILEATETSSSPPEYRVDLTTSSGNPSGAALATSTIQGVTDELNLRLAKVTSPSIVVNNIETSGRKFRFIDFILPGQIGFSLLSMAMFSTVFGFIALKRLLVFKRMFATPVRALTILLSQGTSRLILALIQTAIIVVAGVVLFNFYLPHGWITFAEIMLVSVIGLAAFMGFGIFASGFVSNENAAAPMVNLITLPQFLLSGVFFPTDSLPSWVQPIANNLPLAYFNQAVRKLTTEGGSLPDTLPYLAGLVVWGLVMYILATRTFKWE